MATRAEASAEARPSLSRERVLRAAVKVADEEGIDALTMRRLGRELGSEAMSLYYHVAKKDDVLDGIAELVLTEINEVVDRLDVPSQGADWKKATRQRILSAREVLLRHKWAPAVFESRENTSLAVLRYYDGLLRLMRDGGFSWDLCHHAMHALGSRALGFSQELFDPGGGSGGTAQQAEIPPQLAAALPNLVGMMAEVAHDDPDSTIGWCDDQTEFEFGLDVVLDGLDRLRAKSA